MIVSVYTYSQNIKKILNSKRVLLKKKKTAQISNFSFKQKISGRNYCRFQAETRIKCQNKAVCIDFKTVWTKSKFRV